jgi:cell division initiation protein
MSEDATTPQEGKVEAEGSGTAVAEQSPLRLAQPTAAQPSTTESGDPQRPLERPPDLKIGRRGYDVEGTDAFLSRLEKSFHELTTERDALKRQVAALEQELVHHREQHEAVAEALITAQTLARDVRTSAEAEVENDRAEAAAARASAESDAAEIRAKALQDAETILAEANLQSAKLVEQMQEDVRAKQHEAETILDDAKTKVQNLVHELLDRLPADRAPTEG